MDFCVKMSKICVKLLLAELFLVAVTNSFSFGRTEPPPIHCADMPVKVLSNVLGPAYNSRYMSIQKPIDLDTYIEFTNSTKSKGNTHRPARGSTDAKQPFYVDNTFAQIISDLPAWEVQHEELAQLTDALRTKREITTNEEALQNALKDDHQDVERTKRNFFSAETFVEQVRNGDRPWACEGHTKWLDLGPNYFPQYLRTVECTKQTCWYGHFVCQPRSFTMKLLRKKSGECVPTARSNNIGVAGLPGDIREKWIWEERAINFCCDCEMV